MTDREREPDIRFRFGHDPHAGRDAREHLEPLLCEPDDVIAEDVRLAASELVTNVFRHTEGGGELRAWDPRPEVPMRVEVEDGDPAPPVIPDTTPPVGGRGLTIVASVSDAWGYEPLPEGKVVWAEFDRDRRLPRPPTQSDDTAPGQDPTDPSSPPT